MQRGGTAPPLLAVEAVVPPPLLFVRLDASSSSSAGVSRTHASTANTIVIAMPSSINPSLEEYRIGRG
ncbi:MAG TPA: hypothetical protein VFB62_07735 [Polyangiaceae bacterium]|jgi:hypothetical protein|nr:hypothetical protein [Polyangiaceae bacterium]